MAIQTGTIPTTEEIELESCKDQWELFQKGLLPNFTTKGVVITDKESQIRKRITIIVLSIASPTDVISKSIVHVISSSRRLDENGIAGMAKINQFLVDEIDKSTWIFLGYIKGQKNIPVIILFYEKFNYAVYSVINTDEDMKKLFPHGIPSDISKN